MTVSRKAQSLSMNTIIIAAIGLAVLVVMFAIFTGRIGLFSKGVDETTPDCRRTCNTLGYNSGDYFSGQECSSGYFKVPGVSRRDSNNLVTDVCCCVPNS